MTLTSRRASHDLTTLLSTAKSGVTKPVYDWTKPSPPINLTYLRLILRLILVYTSSLCTVLVHSPSPVGLRLISALLVSWLSRYVYYSWIRGVTRSVIHWHTLRISDAGGAATAQPVHSPFCHHLEYNTMYIERF